jgi:nucleoside-diphosphate-sugar epimerase
MYNLDSLLVLPDDITHILISIPPKDKGDIVYDRFSRQIAKLKNLKWVCFLSSTGVYGDHKGEWVNEESIVSVGAHVARARLIAENQWLGLQADGVSTHIMRLSGIYGPGRSQLENALSGKLKIIDKSDVIFSRIHVDDIVKALVASMASPNSGSIYNLADDYPCNSREVAEFACKLLGITPPHPISLEEAALTEMGMSFYSQSKRVNNSKIKRELSLNWSYPTYKEGMLAIAKECGYQIISDFEGN